MIDILHRETEAVILTVAGKWQNDACSRGYYYALLDGIDLRGACLADADLPFARLDHAILIAADLSEAYLIAANFTDADLTDAKLRSANCLSARFRRANLRGADLSYATLQSADWRGAKLTGATLHRATMKGGRYDQFTVWPDGFVPEKHHLVYVPSTSKREAKRATE